MGNAARWGSGFVIVLEIVGSRYRGDLGIAIEFGWALGYVLLPIFAFFIRDFRLLQLTFTIPEVIFVFLCWKFIPESPRWQLTSGRLKEAERSLRKAAIMNGTSPSDIEPKLKDLMIKYKREEDIPRPNVNVFDLWKYPNLRKKTALLYFTWAVNGFVYYGLSFNTNSLEGNPYINFLLSGAVEVPAYALCMYALTKVGRRTALVVSMVGAGLSFLLILPLSFHSGSDLVWIKTSFAMTGKFFITCSFGIIYLYTCEVYPTVVRTVGLGSSSMAARIGAIVAPFVKELGEATHVTVALAIFGLLSIINALVLLKYGEETTGKDIPDTMEEGDKVIELREEVSKESTHEPLKEKPQQELLKS
jgi:OCT family organic cation transporter-like MFS transporter 4/5